MQAATLLAALTFCFIMLMLAVGLFRQTNADLAGVMLPADGLAVSERIERLLAPARRAVILDQMVSRGEPALRSIYDAMQEEGWTASRLEVLEDQITLEIGAGGVRSFVYRLKPRSRPLPAYTALEASEARRSVTWTLAAQTNDDARLRDLTDFSVNQIAGDVLTQLERWRLADTAPVQIDLDGIW